MTGFDWVLIVVMAAIAIRVLSYGRNSTGLGGMGDVIFVWVMGIIGLLLVGTMGAIFGDQLFWLVVLALIVFSVVTLFGLAVVKNLRR